MAMVMVPVLCSDDYAGAFITLPPFQKRLSRPAVIYYNHQLSDAAYSPPAWCNPEAGWFNVMTLCLSFVVAFFAATTSATSLPSWVSSRPSLLALWPKLLVPALLAALMCLGAFAFSISFLLVFMSRGRMCFQNFATLACLPTLGSAWNKIPVLVHAPVPPIGYALATFRAFLRDRAPALKGQKTSSPGRLKSKLSTT